MKANKVAARAHNLHKLPIPLYFPPSPSPLNIRISTTKKLNEMKS